MSQTPDNLSSLSPDEKRRLLARLLKEKAEARQSALSYGQRALWLLQRLDPNSAAYNVPWIWRVRSAVDVDALRRAFQALVDRHRVLRTIYPEIDGQPVARIQAGAAVDFEQIAADGWSDDELKRRLSEEAHRPFDLQRDLPLRVRLFTRSETDGTLILTFHHIAYDLWSLMTLLDELGACYASHTRGEAASLAEPRPYDEFVRWQGEMLAGPEGERLWKYWSTQMAGELPVLALPADRPRSAVQSSRGATYAVAIPDALARRLRELAQAKGHTLFTLLLSAFQVLLARYSGEHDIVVGSPLTGRTRPELSGVVGYCLNNMPLRGDLSGDPRFTELLDRMRAVVLGALEHQDYPFALLVERLRPKRDPNHSTLFHAMFALNKPHRREDQSLVLSTEAGAGQFELGGLSLELEQSPQQAVVDDLVLMMSDIDGAIGARWQYRTELFDEPTIVRMAGHFEQLLESIAAEPDARMSALRIINDKERQRLTTPPHGDSRYPSQPIPAIFEEQVRRTPDAIAASYGDREISFRELNGRANQLARFLARRGVREGSRVGLLVERSIDMIVAMVGILKAGAAYVPLDPSYPQNRLAFMVEDAGLPLVLCQQSLADRLANPSLAVALDADWPTIAAERDDDPPVAGTIDDAAYVIYTSGSTGRPKGVVVPQRGVVRLVCNTDYVALDGSDRIAQASNASFDAATFEIWGALLTGACTVGIHKDVALSPSELAAAIRRDRITTLFLTTALFNQVVREAPEAFSPLRTLLFGGEAVDAAIVRELLRGSPPQRLLHVYGPTECTTFASWHLVKDVAGEATTVSIGGPIGYTQLYVLDRRFEPVPIGVPGELYVGGDGLAHGYLDRPELTADRFVPNPFSGQPGQRLYRTGDLVRLRAYHSVEFLGRADHQVKIRGFRIEPGEVEAALRQHPGVAEALIDVRELPGAGRSLIAYVVPHESGWPLTEARQYLRERLPEYMVPSVWIPLDAFPLTPNGKVDRGALPAPDSDRTLDEEYVAPRAGLEESLAAIWQEALHLDRVGTRESFFDLGGHSLLLIQVHARIGQLLGRVVPLVDLFRFPTIESLARHLGGSTAAAVDTPAPQLPAVRETVGRDDRIAIIGMAGRFPGAADVTAFWRNLRDGVESIRFFTSEELRNAGVDDTLIGDPRYVPARAVLDGADLFDAAFFGYNPRDAELIDPQQRIFLECASDALERAGYDPDRHAGRIGVYAGATSSAYAINVLSQPGFSSAVAGLQALIGTGPDFVATRASYKLNLRGPSVTVQTACSTSLVAVHHACRSLIERECDIALAGGVSAPAPLVGGYLHQEGGILSPDGHCRAFDANGRGTVSGQGVGLVVLKRLADAIADGDTIHAVILGTAINNDGSMKIGYTAPSVEGQAAVIARAQEVAGVDSSSIGYIEAHGTGTSLGDPIEFAALQQAFGSAPRANCAIGSLKTNIGHLDAAAGVAGLIKAALALEHHELPPSLHFSSPNPKIDFDASPFFVNTQLRPWADGNGPRRAGVSSFGIGGTNAHAVLEEAPAAPESGASRPWQLVVLSAKTRGALDKASANLVEYLNANPGVPFADLAYTLQVGRRTFAHRRAVVCRDAADAAAALAGSAARAVDGEVESGERSCVFLFSGQGAQYAGMARELYESERTFREDVDACCAALEPHLGWDLRDVLVATPTPELTARLKETSVTQPALFVIEYALARLWMRWGVRPAALAGHSIGEYVAACLAGVFSLNDALRLVAARGRLMQSMAPGAMLAVPLSEADAASLVGNELSIAALNAPSLSVVAGPVAAIDALEQKLVARGLTPRRLETSHAFHSAMMEPVLDAFRSEVASMERHEPRIPIVSNVTGTWLTGEEAVSADYWARHLRQPVRFSDCAQQLLSEPGRSFVEIGPGRTLASLLRQQGKRAQGRTIVTSLRTAQETTPDLQLLLQSLGRLWIAGVPIDWSQFAAGESRRRIPLPTYPFDRQRYWIDPPRTVRGTTIQRAELSNWFYQPRWTAIEAPVARELTADSKWLVFADEAGVADRVTAHVRNAGHDVVLVRAGAVFQSDSGGFTIEAANRADYARLLKACIAEGRSPDVIAHFWGVTAQTPDELSESPRCLERGFDSLLFLAQALGEIGLSRPLRLGVVTTDMQPAGDEPDLSPSKAAVLGLCRVIPAEYAHVTTRSIDIDRSDWTDEKQAGSLVAAIAAPDFEPVVALRRGGWLKPSLDPIAFAPLASSDRARLREQGVYLITGGLGGVGLTLAEHLGRSLRARIALVSRTALPDRSEWPAYLAACGEDDRTGRKIRVLQAIERDGGEVLVLTADVSRNEDIVAVIKRTVDHFGRLDGVIHAAGVAPGGIIQTKTRESAARVLAPKIAGTQALARATAGLPLDFLALCSSLTAFLGGAGQSDYCAANAYLDAFAAYHTRKTGTFTVSINWDTWQQVGMAVEADMPEDLARLRAERLKAGILPAEGAEAFERILARAAAPQVAVSTMPIERAGWRQTQNEANGATSVANAVAPSNARYSRPDIGTAFAAPISDIEQAIAAVWQQVLGIDRIGREDNFFDLGGHSLLLVQAHAALVEKLGRDLAVTDLFQFPTIGSLAGHLGGDTRATVRVLPMHVERSTDNAIAIIGMAGRFPGAPDLEQFWANLRDGVESIQTISDDDLRRAGVDERLINDPHYVKVASVLDEIDQFDASFFGYAPREADLLDPQHRVFLECAWEALERAGYDAKRFPGSIGVYAGASWNSYLAHIFANPDIIESVGALQAGIANRSDHLPTRTSYKLNLRGPSINVQTACSTSLVAVHEACRSLVDGECDMALAGGVSISVSGKTGYLYVDQGIGSPDGHCRAFDAKAQGTVWGDGVGVVVLKRVADAVRDGDHIHAIICGTAINNDGSIKVGYTAPSVEGQAAVIAHAQAVAGVEPSSIGYIEAHGTGTTLGDPIEIAALSKAFGPLAAQSCAIGALKSNIGHLDAAAGVAGLIKATLALANRELPPSLHYETPNPKIDFGSSPFFVNSSLRNWESDGKPRRAGVSSFGIGGTNAHAVLEEAPAPSESGPSRSAQVLLVSAQSRAALDQASARLANHLARRRSLGLADVAFTLQVGRQEFGHRRAIVCRDVDQAIDILSGPSSRRALSGQVPSKPGSLGFLFPGEGAYVGMARDLYASEAIFKSAFDDCAARARDQHGIDLPGLVYPDTGRSDAVRDLSDPAAALALFAIEYALAALWRAWGLEPRAVFGQGVGAHVAACVAGVLTLDEALNLAAGHETSITPRAARIHIAKDVDELLNESSSVLLEVGPGRALIDAAARHSSFGVNRVAVPSLGRPRSSEEGLFSILAALGQLWIAGFAIDWARFYETERRRRVPLPTYPFERKRHWIEARPVAEARTSLEKASVADWFYVPSWRQSPSPPAVDTRNSRWLLFADRVGLAARVADRVAGSCDVIVVQQGARFHQESSGRFTIDPGRADDYQALITALRDAGRLPDVIAHFWGVTRETPPEPQGTEICLRLGFFSLLHLAQALGASGSSAPIRISVVTTDVHGVSGDEMLCPSKATALGPCRVIPSEYSHLRCRSVDLVASEWTSPGDHHIDALINEIASESEALVVAYRKARRFLQAAEPSRFDAAGGDAPSRIRDGGVYLITGGLGGVGLTLAGHLARSAKARLVLTSRHGLPDRSEWPAYLAGHGADDRVSRQMRAVEELERAGAAVSVIAADVADASKIQAAVDHARQKYGRLNGVIHAAGVAGGGIIQLKTPEAASSVFAPKIKGTQALARALSREDLDFFVLCSSMTALVGGGGQVDYCAANAYLDAFARYHARQTGTLTIAINWDTWRDVGMAVETEASGRMRDQKLALLVHGIAPAEGVEAFLRILARSTSPQVAVSTVPLSAIAQRLRPEPEHIESSQPDPIRSTSTASPSQHVRPALDIAYAAPVSEIERVIAGVWQELLGIENIGRDDNFFDLGGHSLLLVQMQGTLSKRMGRSLPATDLFRFPTVGSLAAHLGRQAGSQRSESPRDVEPAAAASMVASSPEHAVSEASAFFEPGFTNLPSNAVAIIGMAGRFPGAGDLESFWTNLRNGVESIQPLGDDELRRAGVKDEWLRHPQYVKAASTLQDVDQFDAAFFGYSPREAELLDPQQRIFLECAWEALERAGYDARQHRGQISVFAGSSFNTYLTNILSNAGLVQAVGLMQAGLGCRADFMPTRVSYKLNLHGPSVNVQTACSTSLVAVHQACVSLLLGESDMALAGGVSISISMPDRVGYFYQEEGILSPDGHCRAFDSRAQGTLFGDGVGIVILKRLTDAIADGDTIHAVIRGTAINNDGAAKVGFTAPGVDGQAAVVAKAQASAGIDPSTVSYIEAHGTGTALGDPIEIAALTQVFGEGTPKTVAIGTVKTNIGHLDAAAGIAGLIKTTLMLSNRELPPSLHFESPNPEIDFEHSPFFVNSTLRPWEAGIGPRRAGVSSFGIGGTNAHVVVEEAPAAAASGPSRPLQLIVLSGRSRRVLDSATSNLASYLATHSDVPLADIAHTLRVGRRAFAHRRVVVAASVDEALNLLRLGDRAPVVTAATENTAPSAVFLFSGQGSQYVDMARDLYRSESSFRRDVDACCERLQPLVGCDLRTLMYPDSADSAASEQLAQTRFAQPALFVTEYALARLWIRWGIQPAAMVGHSIGEYVAACLSGVFTVDDALAIVATRGRLMHELPAGAMLAVPMEHRDLLPLLGAHTALAAINAPSLCVASGPFEEIDALESQLAAQGVTARRLQTSHAFHSAMMEPVLEKFAAEVARVPRHAPRIPFISNVTGAWITADEAVSPDYWARHLRNPVQFARAIETLLKNPAHVFVEVGPGRTLSTLVRQAGQGAQSRTVVTSLRHPHETQTDYATMLSALGRLWAIGATVDWQAFAGDEKRRRLPLPTYPFDRQGYWVDKPADVGSPQAVAVRNFAKNTDLASWFYAPSWVREPLANTPVADDVDGSWLVFADAAGVGAALVERLRHEGRRVVVVKSGGQFGALGTDAYTIDHRNPDDYRMLIDELSRSGRKPRRVAHLWSVGASPQGESKWDTFERAQERGFFSVLFLVQALVRQRGAESLELAIVSDESRAVERRDQVSAGKSPVHGLSLVIPQEYPHIRCGSIDVSLRTGDPGSVAERLADELLAGMRGQSVAHRGPQRWIQTFEPAVAANAGDFGPLRERGVYLITGGLGRIGFAVAERLARSVRARLVLVGRSTPPERETWASWLASHPADDKVSRQIDAVMKLEALGAEVFVARADVIDVEAMRAVVSETTRRFGTLHGIIHAAGIVPGSGVEPIEALDRETCRRQFAPKVAGLYALEDAIADLHLDFCLMTSSLSSLLGGLGYGAYAAANQFLDSFADQYSGADARWISVNLDAWGFETDTIRTALSDFEMSPDEGVEGLMRVLASGSVTRMAVSTGDLGARFERYVSRVSSPESTATGDKSSAGHERPEISVEYAEPTNDLERAICEVWQELLGLEQVGVRDDFFELGGHSLLATQLTSRLRQTLQVDLTLRDLFGAPSVAGLAELLMVRLLEEDARGVAGQP